MMNMESSCQRPCAVPWSMEETREREKRNEGRKREAFLKNKK
jgi:hypothetical protein